MRWYLIHTKPAGENVAKVNLERQGYAVYLPRLAQAVCRNGRWRDHVVPLFPRYLFLRVGDGQSLSPVRFSSGVTGVVRFGLRYEVVPDGVVCELLNREDPESGLHRLAARQALAPGALVKVTHGVFNGLEGIFGREEGNDRVVLLLKLLGREVSVRMSPHCVAASHAA